jgi:hypothetical protein
MGHRKRTWLRSDTASGSYARRGFVRIVPLYALWLFASVSSGACQTLGADYISASQAPPAWTQFSKLVKYRFESWIGANDPVAKRLRAYLVSESGRPNGPPRVIEVRAWINPDGGIERVSVPTLKNAQADADLQTILKRGNIGEAPPPEMLQPLNLRFSLNLKK